MSAVIEETVRNAPSYGPERAQGRAAWADNLRLAVVALVIAHHSVEPYASPSAFFIDLPGARVPGLWAFLSVNAAFFMGLMFFLAGAFTPQAYDRRGWANYLRGRFLRIGAPLLLGFLILIPAEGYFYHWAYRPLPGVGYWEYFVRDFLGHGTRPADWRETRWPEESFGHLWFLEHLLIYAVAYVAARLLAGNRIRLPRLPPPRHAALIVFAAALTIATYLIRRVYPQDDWVAWLGFVQVEPAHLPQYASLFAVGLLAARGNWFVEMPSGRAFAWLTLAVALAVGLYAFAGLGLIGGWNAQSLARCAWESTLCVGMAVGAPIAFRDYVNRQGPKLRMVSQGSYAAYVLHFPIVRAIQWKLIALGWPLVVDALFTSVAAILATFALTAALIWASKFAAVETRRALA